MLGPAASADITSNSETCSDLVYRASENTAMDARSGGKYVARETDVSSVYLFGADYSSAARSSTTTGTCWRPKASISSANASSNRATPSGMGC